MSPGAVSEVELPALEPGESGEQYRLRIIEARVIRLERSWSDIRRLRRDVWVGIACILLALAWAQPQLWAPVLAWCANGYQMLRS